MEEVDELPVWRLDPPSVAAVIVSHNGERWLPQTLGSLGLLDYLPTSWIAVDVASVDDSRAILEEALGSEGVISMPVGTGFGESVREALKHLPKSDWIWLLHDDAVVDPKALSALLDEATSEPDIAVVGPKLREWPSLRRLLEVGVTITHTGTRETGLETGEPDAGQHDWSRDVLAVSTAGMLVRSDVWRELDGLDPELRFFFDDIDFGWRVARAGYRTRIAPKSVLFHAEASRRRTRNRISNASEQQFAALYTILANESGPRFWWQSVRLFIGTILRFFAFLVVKDPRSARAQAAALAGVYLSPGRMLRARRRRKTTARVPRRRFKDLFAPAWMPYAHGLDVAAESLRAMVRPESVQTLGRRSSSESFIDEDEVLIEPDPWWKRRQWLGTIVLLTVLSFIAGRGVLSSSLTSAVLPLAQPTLGGWWETLFARSNPVGLGSADWPASYVVPLLAASTPLWWAPGLVIAVLLILAAPLGALTAHRTGRLLTDHRRIRIVWAASYGLIIVASGAVAQGRFGTVVALVVAPIMFNASLRLAVSPTWPMTSQLALWCAVSFAFAPPMVLITAGALVAGLVVDYKLVARHAIAVLLGVVVAGPWLWQRLVDPLTLWWEAGRLVPAPVGVLEVLAGQGGGPGSAPVVFGLIVVGLAVLALVPSHTRVAVSFCWAIAVTGLGVAAIGISLGATSAADGVRVDAWVGLGAAIWLAGLLTAIMFAAPEAVNYGRAVVTILVAIALIFPLGTAVWWSIRGIEDPLTTTYVPQIPSYLADLDYTTAIVTGNINDGGEVRVVTGIRPYLGEESMMPPDALSSEFLSSMQRLVAQPTEEDLNTLASLGLRAIYAPDADVDLQRSLDSASGLTISGSDAPGSRVWILEQSDSASNLTALTQANAVRPWLVGLWLASWVALLVAAVPVRRSEEAAL